MTTSTPLTQDELKALVGQAALRYVVPGDIVGVGTGSTVNKFIDALATVKDQVRGAVSSSVASTERLRAIGNVRRREVVVLQRATVRQYRHRTAVVVLDRVTALQHLRDLNQHNGWLLEGQIERNQQALEVLKPHKETGLYGADGQTATARIAGVKKISI